MVTNTIGMAAMGQLVCFSVAFQIIGISMNKKVYTVLLMQYVKSEIYVLASKLCLVFIHFVRSFVDQSDIPDF